VSLKNRNVRQCNRVACGASFSLKIFLIILGCIWFEVSYSVYQFIGGVNDSRKVFERSASVDIIWVTRRDLDSADHTIWIKQSLPKRYVCVGCQLNSDQALKLLCLKGHVRVCDSTLWRYRWQEASEFLCTKIPLLEGVEQPKNRQKKPKMLPQMRYYCHVFKISRLTPQKNCTPRGCLKARAVLIIELIWGQRFWEAIFFIDCQTRSGCSIMSENSNPAP